MRNNVYALLNQIVICLLQSERVYGLGEHFSNVLRPSGIDIFTETAALSMK